MRTLICFRSRSNGWLGRMSSLKWRWNLCGGMLFETERGNWKREMDDEGLKGMKLWRMKGLGNRQGL